MEIFLIIAWIVMIIISYRLSVTALDKAGLL